MRRFLMQFSDYSPPISASAPSFSQFTLIGYMNIHSKASKQLPSMCRLTQQSCNRQCQHHLQQQPPANAPSITAENMMIVYLTLLQLPLIEPKPRTHMFVVMIVLPKAQRATSLQLFNQHNRVFCNTKMCKSHNNRQRQLHNQQPSAATAPATAAASSK